jgi:hypothetical protein
MAYELHIQRAGREIGLEEWRAAVASIAGLRLAEGDVVGVNPSTNEEIRVRSGTGDVEVLFARGGLFGFGTREEWARVFYFRRGRASFKPGDIDSPADPVRKSAAALARALGAHIVGDEGESYEW